MKDETNIIEHLIINEYRVTILEKLVSKIIFSDTHNISIENFIELRNTTLESMKEKYPNINVEKILFNKQDDDLLCKKENQK